MNLPEWFTNLGMVVLTIMMILFLLGVVVVVVAITCIVIRDIADGIVSTRRKLK